MTPSELDTLADYVEGLLDGTSEGDAVADRIATDPTWADAYQQLAVANPEVTSALQGLADPPLPAEIAAKIERVIATGREESAGPAPQPVLRPVRRLEKRRAAQIGGWAAAAAVVALATVTGVAALHSSQSSSSSTDVAASGPQAARVSGPMAPESVHRSGFNYTTGELGPQARELLEPATKKAAPAPSLASPPVVPGATTASPPPVSNAPRATPPPPAPALSRLTAPSALGACLAALKVADPLAVDYATFDGAPAVVIVTPGPETTRLTVLAAGPNCGLNGETDQLARVDVAR